MNGDTICFQTLFTQEKLDRLFPPERADQFFEALLGDAHEGAYDIRLTYKGCRDTQLLFDFELHQRPGKCLACHVTYGLPAVFARHPVINIAGLVAHFSELLSGQARCVSWKLGQTREKTPTLHVVPFIVAIAA